MSRIGRKPISLPPNVTVHIDGNLVTVKGPRGTLARTLPPAVSLEASDRNLVVKSDARVPGSEGYWGLARQLVANMVKGVSEGFSKGLELQGGGYKASLEGRTLVLALGFAHDIRVPLPENVDATIKENIITLTSPDKEKLGQFAAEIRRLRPPDVYRAKGIRYVGEVIRKKEVKAATQQGGT